MRSNLGVDKLEFVRWVNRNKHRTIKKNIFSLSKKISKSSFMADYEIFGAVEDILKISIKIFFTNLWEYICVIF